MAVRGNGGEGEGEHGLRAKLLLTSGVQQASDVKSDGEQHGSSMAMSRMNTAATAVTDAGSAAGGAGGGRPRGHSKAVSFVSSPTAVASSDADAASHLHAQPPSAEAPAPSARGKGALKGILRGIGFGLGLNRKASGDAAAGPGASDAPDGAGTALRSASSGADVDVESGPCPAGQVTPRYGTPGTPDQQEGSPASPVPQTQGPTTPTTSRATEGVVGSIPFRIISPTAAASATLSSPTSTAGSATPSDKDKDKALKDENCSSSSGSGQVVSPFSVVAGSSFGVESSSVNGGMGGGRAMSAATSGALAPQPPPWLERIFSYLSLSTETEDQQVGAQRVNINLELDSDYFLNGIIIYFFTCRCRWRRRMTSR